MPVVPPCSFGLPLRFAAGLRAAAWQDPVGATRMSSFTSVAPDVTVNGIGYGRKLMIHDHHSKNGAMPGIDSPNPELLETAETIRALLDAAEDAAFLLDEHGKFLALNRAAAERIQARTDELLGKSILDLLPADEASQRREILHRIFREGKPGRHAYERQSRSFDTKLYPIFGKNNRVTAVAGFSRDVTDQKRADKALLLSEMRFREIYDNSPVMMHSINMEGVILNVNKKWLEVLGYTRDEVINRSLDLIMTPESARRAFGDILPRYWSQGKIADVSYQYVRKDRTVIDVLLDSTVMNDPDWGSVSLSVIRDVTAQKKAEQALRRSEERFRAIFEGVKDCIYIKDRTLRFSHVNPAMEKLLGRHSAELIGLTADDIYGEEAGQHIRQVELRVLQGESVEEEHTRPVRDARLTFHDMVAPLRSATGHIIGICGISRNITERKKIGSNSVIAMREYPSEATRETLAKARYAAAKDSIILLLGESGSGKDHLARWIHAHSRRCNGPYFAINCAAVPHDLAESELFGHEAGAFTGARGRKRGLLELAEGGTLLLNEIGELSVILQSKLLTFLDTKSFLRVGGERSVHVNARLIAATHRDLAEEVGSGRFSQPLFYRLNVFSIELPPLRRRLEDIPILVEEIMAGLATEMHLTETPVLDADALNNLTHYHWPGNIRELRNVLERSVMVSTGNRIRVALPRPSTEQEDWWHKVQFPASRNFHHVIEEVITTLCKEALKRTGGAKKGAAELLGISRDSFYRYMKRFEEPEELLPSSHSTPGQEGKPH
jgi:PAS domain S-box-containing protein